MPPPNLCGICNNKVATVHLTQIFKGKVPGKIEVREIDLCEDCARKNGFDAGMKVPLLTESAWEFAVSKYVDDPETA